VSRQGRVARLVPPSSSGAERPVPHSRLAAPARWRRSRSISSAHAAIWALLAFVAVGDGDKAGELFAILNPINHASSRAGVYR